MGLKLAELAVRYGCELRGDPDLEVSRVGTLQDSAEGAISFLANPAYARYLPETRATAVVLTAEAADESKVACLIAEDPYAVYAAIAGELYPVPVARGGTHPAAVIGSGCTIPDSCEIAAGAVLGDNVTLGERVTVGSNSVIGDDCEVGDDTLIYPNVTLYHDVRIGARTILHSSTVVGGDGFGIAQTPQGWLKVPQVGGVTIGDDVEVGAACTIDRGAIEDTVIGNGVKLDSQVHVAHNVRIGDHTAIAGQSGVSGSTTIGARCIIGGASAVSGHLTLVDDVYLMGRSNVSKSISKPGVYSSVISVEEAGTWRKLAARFKRLDDMAKKLRGLENQLKSSADNNADNQE